jgi:phosphoglycerate dehydrogenase-like enzyme
MTRVSVAVLDDYQDVALSFADWSAVDVRADVTVFRDHASNADALAARLARFDVIVAMRERTPFPAALLARLPRLKLLITTGMRNPSIDIAAARARGVVVSGTSLPNRQTAELAWALVMATMRSIAIEDRATREGHWQTTVGRELVGSTIGIVGLGSLGSVIASWAQAFGMTVLAWSPNLDAEVAAQLGAEAVGKDELFERSDVVTLHIRYSDRTRGLVGQRELELLGPDGYLVNTSRGPIVDEDALVAALRAGTIAGAGLDVFGTEPLPAGHPLLSTPNTTLSPHKAFVADRAYRGAYADAVEDILAWLDGAPVRVLEPKEKS